jgi:hypothetical protein
LAVIEQNACHASSSKNARVDLAARSALDMGCESVTIG